MDFSTNTTAAAAATETTTEINGFFNKHAHISRFRFWCSLSLFGGATTLEGNSADVGTPSSTGSAALDVLLYNFFGSSPLKEQWRIINEYMKEKLCPLNPETYPTFTNAKHDVLCYELKILYVAITRTRQRLWICEDSDGLLSPMADYWQKLKLIQFKKLDESFARFMQVSSSSENWRSRGIEQSNSKIPGATLQEVQ